MEKKLNELTLIEAVEKLRNRSITSEALVSACIDKIENSKNINAVLSYDREYAIRLAKIADEKLNNNVQGKLLGIPVLIKDNMTTTYYKTTCASKMLENYVSPYNATVVEKLEKEGAIIIGKTNMDEFAIGGSGENSAFGPTLNPCNNDYIPGGSSSGSTAAVADNECIISLGSDTGGSIRQPAGFCGVTGIKPTYGRVSRYGLVAYASSLDQIGPIGKSAEDCAYLLDCIKGVDEKDFTSVSIKDQNFYPIDTNIKGMKIGIVKELFELKCSDEVKENIDNVIKFYKDNGVEFVNVSMPHISKCLAAYYIIASAEVSSNLSRFDGIKFGNCTSDYSNVEEMLINTRSEYFGNEVKRRIMIGNYVLNAECFDAYYKKAVMMRNEIIKEFEDVYKKCDAIICPPSPSVGIKFGDKLSPLELYMLDIFTVPVNIFGGAGITFKSGVSKKLGLPIGCQLISDKWQESKILKLASYYEKNAKNGGR